MISYGDIASMIDHSLLNPVLTDQEIIEGCNIALKYQVASVCCRPSDVILAKKILDGSAVKLTTVIGFPHGSATTNSKLFECEEAIRHGCSELDIVINIGKHRTGNYDYVKKELKKIVDFCHSKDVLAKIIFENCYLDTEQKISACRICNEVRADYVKTSTGYGSGGATDEDLKLMRKYADPKIKIKAAGGIRTLERAIEIRMLGVSRFGATATVGILERLKRGC